MAMNIGNTVNLQYKEYIFDVMKKTISARLEDHLCTDQLRFEKYQDMLTQDMIYQLQLFVAAKSHQTMEQGKPVKESDTVTNHTKGYVETPATWWDHLKQTIGWKWLNVNKKKHEYTSVSHIVTNNWITNNTIHKTTNICPHTIVDPALKHMTFIMSEVV